MTTSHSDDILDHVGFLRTDIIPLLESAGILIDGFADFPSQIVSPPPKPLPPPDILPFVPRVNITLAEAANLLAEVNGGDWWATLEDAVDSGLIQAGNWGIHRGGQPLVHANIREWCATMGIVWPVPLPPGATPTTDAGLREILKEVTRERDALRDNLESLTSELNEQKSRTSHAENKYWTEYQLRITMTDIHAKELAALTTEIEEPRSEVTSTSRSPRHVVVEIPHMTRGLDAMFRVFREQWSDFRQDNPPKSSAVAAELDAAIGWKTSKSGEASRNAQAVAALLRPDEIADADPRNARRR